MLSYFAQTLLPGFFEGHGLREDAEKGLRDLYPVLKRIGQLGYDLAVLCNENIKKMIVRNRKGDSIWTVSLPMFVIFCFYFSVRILLWRFASNRQTAVATAAFRDSTRPLMGMRIA